MVDRVASGLFFTLGILVMIESSRLSLDSLYSPGPGFVPFFLGLSMAGLSLLAVLNPDQRLNPTAFWNNLEKGGNVLYIFAGLAVYLSLIRVLGFFTDTLLLMVYLMKLSGEKGYTRALVVSLLTTAFVYLLFYRLLQIPLPIGMLGV